MLMDDQCSQSCSTAQSCGGSRRASLDITATAASMCKATTACSISSTTRSNTSALATSFHGFLRNLPLGKQYAILSMLCLSTLQVSAVLNMIVQVSLHGPEGLTASTPIGVLVLLLLGTMLEFAGVLYIVLPGPASTSSQQATAPPDDSCSFRSSGSNYTLPSSRTDPHSTHRITLTPGFPTGPQRPPPHRSVTDAALHGRMAGRGRSIDLHSVSGDDCRQPMCSKASNPAPDYNRGVSIEKVRVNGGSASGHGPLSRRRSSVSASRSMVGEGVCMEHEAMPSMCSRAEALAGLQVFMQALEQQPMAYSLDMFIHGAASAIQGIFPDVHHASFCLLNADRTSTSVYTFLGEGAQSAPYASVAVAPGTLIYYVLHTSQPVFIPDIAAFLGPFSDLQFMHFAMGLQSVACLPLVLSQQQVLGVLRMGFDNPREWDEHEQSLAQQLALVLSSSTSSFSSSPSAEPPIQTGMFLDEFLPADPHQQRALDGGILSSDPHSHMGALGLFSNGGGSSASPPSWGVDSMSPHGGARHALDGLLPAHLLSPAAAAAAAQAAHQGLMHAGAEAAHHFNMGGAPGAAGSGWQSQAHTQSHAHAHAHLLQLLAAEAVAAAAAATAAAAAASPSYGSPMGTSEMASPAMYQASPRTRSGFLDEMSASAETARTTSCSLSEVQQDTTISAGGAITPSAREHVDLKMLEVIGRGGFSSVFKALWRGKMVAVKVLEHGDELQGCCDGHPTRTPTLDASGRRAALLEGAMTSTMRHPNVVHTYDFRVVNLNRQVHGHGMSMSRVLQETHIIMDFCDRGSLQEAMEQRLFFTRSNHSGSSNATDKSGSCSGTGVEQVDMQAILKTLAEVATAMAYLHAHRITHRDLKPKNILLKASNKDSRGFRSLVSDFGLSQVLPDKDSAVRSTKHSGTVTHMPPELIEEGKVYQQGDAYAFGIVMWEIYTSTSPYSSMAQPQIMVAVVTHDMRPKFPDSCPEWYKSLANKCWRKDPQSRPSFQDIANYLMTMITDKNWSAVGDGAEDAESM